MSHLNFFPHPLKEGLHLHNRLGFGTHANVLVFLVNFFLNDFIVHKKSENNNNETNNKNSQE